MPRSALTLAVDRRQICSSEAFGGPVGQPRPPLQAAERPLRSAVAPFGVMLPDPDDRRCDERLGSVRRAIWTGWRTRVR